MEIEELKAAIDAHELYLRTRSSNAPEGVRFVAIDANLQGADLRDADLQGADLRDADLRGADLRDADLWDANLRGANLRDANLRDANLQGANLWGADLRGADLRDASLRGADLWGTIGNNREIVSLQALKYPIAYTIDLLQIGCKNFPITQWWDFDDETIAAMDSGALDWWRVHKPILQALIAANPARGKSEK